MQRKKIIIGFITLFIISISLYWYGLVPTVPLVDGGELITAAYLKGIAHPPGFPTYLLISHLFSLIPIGNVAQRINFVSCLFAALSVGTFFLLCNATNYIYSELVKKRLPAKKKKDSTKSLEYNPFLSSYFASLLLIISFSLWSYAEMTEVYTMNLFLLLLTFLLLLFSYKEKIDNNKINNRLIILAGFIYGLGLGIHHITMILMVPALLYILLNVIDFSFIKSRNFILSVISTLIGLSTYLYLIIAARSKPVLNWGNPDNCERFLRHVSAWQYRSNIALDTSQIFKELKEYSLLLLQQYGWIALTLITAGLIIVLRQRFLRYLFILIFLSNLSYGLIYSIAEDKDAYYLPTYVFACILFSLVLHKYNNIKSKLKTTAIYLIALIAIVSQFWINIKILPKNKYYIGEKYVEDTLKSMQKSGLYLTQDWQIYSPLFYFQHIYNKRPDIISIDINLLKRSWYVGHIAYYYPEIAKFSYNEITDFLKKVSRFEKGASYDANELQKAYLNLINSFIEYAHSNNQAVYIGLIAEEGVATSYKRIPIGLVFYLAENYLQYLEAPNLDLSEFAKSVYKKDKVVNEKVAPFYATMLTNRGIYLNRLRLHKQAITLYQQALQIKQDKKIYELLADSFLLAGDKDKARYYYTYIINIYGSTTLLEKKLQMTY